ncbi:hypothetical protein [Candidatus Venteria ishoeyi]|uniref:Uncharacterized protein n=1 Tax=Candidatus Venteria ishoeyi TaxID=1899563 RepID=A0A1H6FJ92_9GAMM|nr:hypothetical protein [Candidatus Venteria ishoeyi]MDM8546798.1 hypothetical protein [Candidatus Venteria ishoeyi]SEH09166.1 Uncharacterised protein [Candidatus Venteria ishoeyi]SEH09295.1 Uncharacterised protein [Candidatus Venteria ishoeyi]
MNPKYQQVADMLYQMLGPSIGKLREDLSAQGVAVEHISKETMSVELIAQVLVQALAQERLAFSEQGDLETASQQALKVVRDSLIQYRQSSVQDEVRH